MHPDTTGCMVHNGVSDDAAAATAAARRYSVASAAFSVADGRITASVAAASGW
jgi:hypothetical protein